MLINKQNKNLNKENILYVLEHRLYYSNDTPFQTDNTVLSLAGPYKWMFLAFRFIVCDVIKEINVCNIRTVIKPVYNSDPASIGEPNNCFILWCNPSLFLGLYFWFLINIRTEKDASVCAGPWRDKNKLLYWRRNHFMELWIPNINSTETFLWAINYGDY